MAVTLRDVAERAGVSVRTVSNVVNGFRHVSPDMREKVQAALAELDYRPNLLARSLRQGRTGLIALIVPEIAEPYFAEGAHVFIEQARTKSWTVLIDETAALAERELEVLDLASRSRMVDGVLLNALGLTPDQLSSLAVDVPVVLIGEQASDRFDHVTWDNVEATMTAVGHLAELGCRRIAAIGRQPEPTPATSRLRLKGYQQAIAAAGLPDDPALYPEVALFTRADGAAAMAQLLTLDDPPDGVFCFNDRLAIGALHAAREAGLDVPGALKIVGFDDIDEAAYANPPLTTIRPDKPAVARNAVEALQRRIEGDESAGRRILVGHELVVRRSTVA